MKKNFYLNLASLFLINTFCRMLYSHKAAPNASKVSAYWGIIISDIFLLKM